MKYLYFILIIILYASCTDADNHNSSPGKENALTSFKMPIIYQNPFLDSIIEFNEKNLNYTFFEVARKSQYCDTLKISLDSYQDSTIGKDLNRRFSDSVLNNISFDGFEIKTDYSKCVYKNWLGPGKLFPFYPVYIINTTAEIKYFPGKDSYAFGIQEALDSNGIWRPIEGRGFDFCGNGYWNLKINPNEYLILLAKKYTGSYSTKLRTRIKIGNIVYVSKSFDGVINYDQFFIDKNSVSSEDLKEDKASTIQNIFYGAIPIETKMKNVVNHAVIAQQP